MKSQVDFRVVLSAIALVIATFVVLPAADKTPKFTAGDRKIVNEYYMHLFGEIAPGTINRYEFSVEIERALKPDEKLPLQLEKKLETLPRELEEKLSGQPAGYAIYKLGHHVLILRRSDLLIADIIKNAGLGPNE